MFGLEFHAFAFFWLTKGEEVILAAENRIMDCQSAAAKVWSLRRQGLGKSTVLMGGEKKGQMDNQNMAASQHEVAAMALEEISAQVRPSDREAERLAGLRQTHLTKPPGSLGRLEEAGIKLAGAFGVERPAVRKKLIVVVAADHGVVTQGVTSYPQEVTAQMVANFLAGGAAINCMARRAGVDLEIVDAGMVGPLPDHRDLRVVSVRRCSGDITRGPAMTRGEAKACVRAGVAIALEAAEAGADLIGTGDMGIGSTTPSSAITAAVMRRSPSETTGRGTGRDDQELAHKVSCVERALEVNQPDVADGLDVLSKVGGLEIGVLAGLVLGGAFARRAVVLDGFVSGAAALIAHSLCPTVGDYIFAGHLSAEPGHRLVLSHLGLEPLLDLGMRLGEGTGAVLAMGLLEAAAQCLAEMATFAEADVSNREPED